MPLVPSISFSAGKSAGLGVSPRKTNSTGFRNSTFGLANFDRQVEIATANFFVDYPLDNIPKCSFQEALNSFEKHKDRYVEGTRLCYFLDRPPTKEELKSLTRLERIFSGGAKCDPEIGLWRIKSSHQWIIVNGSSRHVSLPEQMLPFFKSGLIDRSLHRHPGGKKFTDYPSAGDIFCALEDGAVGGILVPEGIVSLDLTHLTHPETRKPWFPRRDDKGCELNEFYELMHSKLQEEKDILKHEKMILEFFDGLSMKMSLIPWENLDLERFYLKTTPALKDRLVSEKPVERAMGLAQVSELFGIESLEVLSAFCADTSDLVAERAVSLLLSEKGLDNAMQRDFPNWKKLLFEKLGKFFKQGNDVYNLEILKIIIDRWKDNFSASSILAIELMRDNLSILKNSRNPEIAEEAKRLSGMLGV